MTSRRRPVRLLLVSALAAGGLVASTGPARADFHLMMIREVSAGSDSGAAGDFVELQMHESGQNLVTGKHVRIFVGGTEVASATFGGPVGSGAGQASILLAPSGSGLSSDATLSAPVPAEGGKACFVDPGTSGPYPSPDQLIDCVAWGSQTQDADTGPPAPVIPSGQSIERTIARGCTTALDPADDTNNSAADLAVDATPSPRPNGVPPTEQACGPGGGGGSGFFVENLKARVRGNRAIISGRIEPPVPGNKVRLTFFANGSPLRRVAKANATLNAESRFKRGFRVPAASTRCKVKVTFEGAPMAQKKFGC